MKISKILILVLFLATLLTLFCDGVGAQGEPVYLGEFCFDMTPADANVTTTSTLQLGVLSFGDGHFSVHGRITTPGIIPFPVYGTAIVIYTEDGRPSFAKISLTSTKGGSGDFSFYELRYGLTEPLGLADYTESLRYSPNCLGCIPPPVFFSVIHGTLALRPCS